MSRGWTLVDTGLAAPARFVTLRGGFAFDALSPDARYLYLIEHLGAVGSGHYQVRAYDSTVGWRSRWSGEKFSITLIHG